VPLHHLYPGRTFRFCFTNRQMATAVTRFIWTHEELRPDREPIYMAQWEDDAYSQDLVEGFGRVLRFRVAENITQQWGWLSGYAAQGAFPPAAAALVVRDGPGFRLDSVTPVLIDSSVGSFSSPNTYEARAVQYLLAQIHPPGGPALGPVPPFPVPFRPDEGLPRGEVLAPQRRPLLVVSGQSQPSRRLLRDLARNAPDTAHRFVVATGDAISFNTLYRDRRVAWPIQDLPFKLVMFCHLDPIDPDAGFRPCPWVRPLAGRNGEELAPGEGPLAASTGTDDVLLCSEIVEALAQAFGRDGARAADADELGRRLKGLRWSRPDYVGCEGTGTRLFHDDGQRQAGTGEHVVYLRPIFEGERVLPEAEIEVWVWETDGGHRVWRRRGEPLKVSYEETFEQGEPNHGD
jgi:hypothetical protein